MSSMHFLHMIDPQAAVVAAAADAELIPAVGQKGTSWSLTQGTTDFSIAVGRMRQKPSTHKREPAPKKKKEIGSG